MTNPTREEIERLVSDLKNGDWRRFNAFVADDRLTTAIKDVKAERDALRVLAETVCAFIDGEGRAVDTEKAGEAIRALRYALAGLTPKDASR